MTVMLYLFPLLVIFLEYYAFSSALAYARYYIDYHQLTHVELLGGLVTVGGNLPYDAVPNAVMTIHVLSLLLSLVFLVYFLFFGWDRLKQESPNGEEQI